mgnify:CR=1 FL=1
MINAVAGACLMAQKPRSLEGFGQATTTAATLAPGATEIRIEQGMQVEYRMQPWGQWARNRIVGVAR